MGLDGMPEAGFSASFESTGPSVAAAAAAEPSQGTTQAAPSFAESLPEELRASKWVEKFGKLENPLHELAKGYEHSQIQIGKLSSRIEIPGENATPEQTQAYRKALGLPETADGYGYNDPDLSKESEDIQKLWKDSSDENFTKSMKAAAHEAGLTPKQFEGLTQKFNQFQLDSLKGLVEKAGQLQQERSQAEVASFQKVFGDKAEAVRTLAKETLTKIGLPAEFQSSPDAALIFAMDYIHKNLFANDGIDSNPSVAAGQTKAEVRNQIMKLRDDTAYKNKYPIEQYKRVASQLDELYRQEATMTE